jgi:hypothetical protein
MPSGRRYQDRRTVATSAAGRALSEPPRRIRPVLKVVIADDHRLILDGIKNALVEDGGFEIVGEATSG